MAVLDCSAKIDIRISGNLINNKILNLYAVFHKIPLLFHWLFRKLCCYGTRWLIPLQNARFLSSGGEPPLALTMRTPHRSINKQHFLEKSLSISVCTT